MLLSKGMPRDNQGENAGERATAGRSGHDAVHLLPRHISDRPSGGAYPRTGRSDLTPAGVTGIIAIVLARLDLPGLNPGRAQPVKMTVTRC